MPKSSYAFSKVGNQIFIDGKGRTWAALRRDAQSRQPKAKSLAAWKAVVGRGVDWPGLDTGPSSFFGRKGTRAKGAQVIGSVRSAKMKKLMGGLAGGGAVMVAATKKRKKKSSCPRKSSGCSGLDWLIKANVKKS